MSSTKKLSQKELREMMRDMKESKDKEGLPSLQKKTIESPLARYDSRGILSCIVCQQTISSAALWSSHIVSKSHKMKMEEMKRRKSDQKRNESKSDVKIETKPQEVKQTVKRKMETNSDEIQNKLSKNTSELISQELANESNEVMETNDDLADNSKTESKSQESGLPSDFFDDSKQIAVKNEEIIESKDEEMDTNDEEKGLPKGFFDDPVMDAKARKVVFKNPMDEQWEQFQKVIAEENNASENIIVEDIEELQVDRNLEEIEEQIANWQKVNEMQKKAEILHNHIVNKRDAIKEESSDSDADEYDLNVFSNWRSRKALNSK
ncbi:unnamed protein product [Medioppia subpectinata]|uniref:Zinc finger protein 830 n=1 Tax=Medioppia subpectinata TaxID=1979941 RepID=A0A7R9L6J8_9ACAR|nr:unnamed protein product [Medioppia subpectinata]CAG2116283.1 unnamed protein product [Medioppia subpectinata]